MKGARPSEGEAASAVNASDRSGGDPIAGEEPAPHWRTAATDTTRRPLALDRGPRTLYIETCYRCI